MQKYDVSKYIISQLAIDLSLPKKAVINRILISNIVEGWNNNIYIQPQENIKTTSQSTPKKYLM